MNIYTIKNENITAEEFAKCCYDALEQTKIAYLAADGSDYADVPFESALKKVITEDATFIKAQISAESHQKLKLMIDFFIHCIGGKVTFGIAKLGPFRKIDMYISY